MMLMLFIIIDQFLIAHNDQATAIFPATGMDYNETLKPDAGFKINIWYGMQQKVGHLGYAQEGFNLLGNVVGFESLVSLTYSLNGATPEYLKIGRDRFGDKRRLAAPGDFNADISVSRLRYGRNKIDLTAIDSLGKNTSVTVTLERLQGHYQLPVHIDWNSVADPQDVGQYVDGRWGLEKDGLRTLNTGYDRIFLIGDTSWKDYEVTLNLTIQRVDAQTGPLSGGNGIGILMRFAGHITGGHRNFPSDQPKWGYQPFGAIGWLRWKDGQAQDPSLQFYRGDNDQTLNFGTLSLNPGNQYMMKMKCMTLPDEGVEGVTKYCFKIWSSSEEEPPHWFWETVQRSQHALRKGGIVLLAHHVDATFGEIEIVCLSGNSE